MNKLILLIILTLFGIIMLTLLQHYLIYHPRSYGSHYLGLLEYRIQKLHYMTEEGNQTAFYWPPEGDNPPKTLWILFGGNGALALDWIWLVEKASKPETGFLLIDYPGFGDCEGRASPETILASSEVALEHWLEYHAQGTSPEISILGHSLGTGAGLLLAEKIEVSKVLLLSPFTSFADMTRRLYSSWLVPLLRHRFENKGPIRNLLLRNPIPEIMIFHGSRDEVIPVDMGRELAEIDKVLIQYIEYPSSFHNNLLQEALPKIIREIKGD